MLGAIFDSVQGVAAVSGGAGVAATSGGVFTVQPGDTLSLIAAEQYRNADMWTVIHSTDLAEIGESPNWIRAGMRLALGCIDWLPLGLEGGLDASGAAPRPAEAARRKVSRAPSAAAVAANPAMPVPPVLRQVAITPRPA